MDGEFRKVQGRTKNDLLHEMSDKDFELYIYTLRKLADEHKDSERYQLTGLYNLRAFQYEGNELMLAHPELTFALVVLDFANFKFINEFCGREGGDQLLVCTAGALREQQVKRQYTLLAQVRADIFAILTPYENKKSLIDMIEQIDHRISSLKIPYKVLPAFGICIADSPTMSISLMRDYATMAMKSIKGKFYDKYAFFDENMNNRMMLNKMIENDIMNALDNHQLVPYFQPKVDMTTGRIIGAEALVRWLHPNRGLVPPGQFIPVLENNGLVIDVDICIWEQVFAFLGKRIAEGKKIVPVSVNISRMHVYDKRFPTILPELASKYRVPTSYIYLELTESGFVADSEKMYANMEYLREWGFCLSVDDVGTGYSTLTMLKNTPVDEIKLDRNFIIDISTAKSRSVILHTVDMLRDLDLDIIVEGVETPEQKQFLLDCDCRYAQGFLYYKPMPMTEFEVALDREPE